MERPGSNRKSLDRKSAGGDRNASARASAQRHDPPWMRTLPDAPEGLPAAAAAAARKIGADAAQIDREWASGIIEQRWSASRMRRAYRSMRVCEPRRPRRAGPSDWTRSLERRTRPSPEAVSDVALERVTKAGSCTEPDVFIRRRSASESHRSARPLLLPLLCRTPGGRGTTEVDLRSGR